VVVLIAGRPPLLGAIADQAAAILMAWFPGPAGNRAIAELLTGQREPSGRLSVSLPRSSGAMPYAYNHKALARGVPSQPMFDPQYAFGHGLSYTQFDWSGFSLSAPTMAVDGQVQIHVTLRNTGQRPGTEVVQLYVRDLLASVTRPVQELKGFQRVDLQPGQAARLCFTLHADVLAFSGPDPHRLVVEPGALQVALAASSTDWQAQGTLTLTGALRQVAQRQHFLAEVALEWLR